MSAVVQSPPQRRLPAGAGAGRSHQPGGPVAFAFVTAWGLMIVAETTGAARHFDHDVVFEGSLPAGTGVGLFVLGWLVTVAAMMLPTTLPALRGLADRALGAFLGGFALVWAIVGVIALGFDMVVHRVVHGVPALEARPWFVAAGVLALAGAVQLLPATRRSLAASSRPASGTVGRPRAAFRAGLDHGRLCLRGDGPLMFVMFAAAGSLAWMAVLTAVMAAERSSRGHRVAAATGAVLVAGAAVVALNGSWLPSPFSVE